MGAKSLPLVRFPPGKECIDVEGAVRYFGLIFGGQWTYFWGNGLIFWGNGLIFWGDGLIFWGNALFFWGCVTF